MNISTAPATNQTGRHVTTSPRPTLSQSSARTLVERLDICVRRMLRSANPEEMNADVSSNRFRDEQQICGHDKRGSPCTRRLRMDVIWANSQKMVIQTE